ncbi:MAG TPA: hypothetical protein VMS84_00145 [Mycobacterium sp.]|nr:hypothetical protein [Mycobacterium sp.]
MQPIPSVDLTAELRELGTGLFRGTPTGKLEEPVALTQGCAVLGWQACIEHQEAPDPRHIGAAVQK